MSRISLTDTRERHFQTGSLKPDLSRRAAHSGALMLGSQAIAAAVALGTTLVLVRLLEPADFGLVAMALPVVVLGTVLRTFGLDVAIIQRDELNQRQVSALFWLALKLNVALTGVILALAPVLAWFFAEPNVAWITAVLGGGVLALGLGGIHEALLKRQMRFGALAIIALVAAIGGGAIAIALASAGAGYWALVGQVVASNVIQFAGAWIGCDWRPVSPSACAAENGQASRAMISFGRNLTAARVLTVGSNYADRIAIGWISGPVVLGLYENGRRLPFFVLDKLYEACFSVAVSGFSRAGNDASRYRAFGARTIQLVLGILLPVLAFIMVEAETVIVLLLGDQWLPAVPYARLLALAAFGQGLTRTLQWFYLSRDDTARQFRWIVLQTAITLVAVGLGGWLGGAFGVAVGFTTATCLLPLPAIVYGLRHSPFSPADFGRAAVLPVGLALGCAAILVLLEIAGAGVTTLWIQCALAALIYAALYMGGWMLFPAGRELAVEGLQLFSRAVRTRPVTEPPCPPDPPV